MRSIPHRPARSPGAIDDPYVDATGNGPTLRADPNDEEVSHDEGLVRPESIHHCTAFAFHLCSAQAGAILDTLDPEAVDLMFPFVTYKLKDKLLDPGNDDYYAHPFPTRDLADSPYWED